MNNWKTTLGGLLVALGMARSSIPAKYQWIAELAGVAGGALVGMTAKDFDNHSTVQEVEKATVEAKEK
jgi:hypothetical protein